MDMLTSGSFFNCAIKPGHSRQLQCWGQNVQGQLDIPKGMRTGVAKVQAGGAFVCAVREQHSKIMCWGGYEFNLGVDSGAGGVGGIGRRGSGGGSQGNRNRGGNTDEAQCLYDDYDMFDLDLMQNIDLINNDINIDKQTKICKKTDTKSQNDQPPESIYHFKFDINYFAVGGNYVCIINKFDVLDCFGEIQSNMDTSRIGSSDEYNRKIPFPEIPTVLKTGISRVFIGYNHTCVIKLNSKLQCWGQNIKNYIKPFSDQEKFKHVSISFIIYAIDVHDRVQVHNYVSKISQNSDQTDIIGFFENKQYLQINSNCFKKNRKLYEYLCIIDKSRKLTCISRDFDSVPTPINVPKQFNSRTISQSSGMGHQCATKSTNEPIKCWGQNKFDQTNVPSIVNNHIQSISIGFQHYCQINGYKYIECKVIDGMFVYGNQYGQIDIDERQVEGVEMVGTGSKNTCVLVNDEFRSYGQDQDDGIHQINILDDINELLFDIDQNDNGDNDNEINYSSEDGFGGSSNNIYKLECYGSNSNGLNDIPSSISSFPSPHIKFSLYNKHACLLDHQQKIYCWGSNKQGQLDISENGSIDEFVKLKYALIDQNNTDGINSIIQMAIDVSTGGAHTCYIQGGFSLIQINEQAVNNNDLISDKIQINCIGYDMNGQSTIPLNYLDQNAIHNPIQNHDIDSIYSRTITAGYKHSCVIQTNGHVFCWGRGFSPNLINESFENQDELKSNINASMIKILNRKLDEEYEKVNKIVVGRNHSCILCESKIVQCFRTDKNISESITKYENLIVQDIDLKQYETCIIDKNGILKCLGKLQKDFLKLLH